MILDNIGEAGQKKRKVYQRRLPEDPNKDYYYILRETGNVEPVLVEYGFVDNNADATKLRNNLEDYVEGVVKAIAEYIGFPYYPPDSSDLNKETYTVKPGDTLYKISNMFGISIDELKKINNLKNDNLTIGQIIKLTPDANNYISYIVKKGDTLYSIANAFKTSVEELKKLNKLDSNNLYIGQILTVPNNDPSNQNSYDEYIVVRGDSLWSIANKYGITVDELIKINSLSNLTLKVGDILKVPKKDIGSSNTYIVKSGDTLWSISKKFDLSVDELKKINNLSNNMLSIGQELIIK